MADQGNGAMTAVADFVSRRSMLDDEASAALLALPHGIRKLGAGEHFLREGERPDTSTILLDGYVYRHKIVGDGGRQIVAVHIPGDLVDLQNLLLHQADHNIQALTPATIAQFPHRELLKLAFRHPAIGEALWRESLVEASLFREWIVNVGRRDAQARLAHLLCELAIRREIAGIGPKERFELPMSQEQLGDALGLTAVHVNRTLRALEEDGLIQRTKRAVRIADWERLRAAADFSTDYLHLREPRD